MAVLRGVEDVQATLASEEYLIISSLHERQSLTKNDLWEIVHAEQDRVMLKVFGSSKLAHTKSAFNYWIKSLKKEEVITESERGLQLNGAGFWLASVGPDRFHARINFLRSWLCKCSSNAFQVVFLSPSFARWRANAKGETWVGATCLRCSVSIDELRLPGKMDAGRFIEFYNEAAKELSCFINVVACPLHKLEN